MKPWAGTGPAYAASYAALCAGTEDAVLDELGSAGGRPALDVGAGTGAFVARLVAAGWDAVGCEPEPTMRAVAADAHPGIRILDAALPRLPFDDGGFAAVTANFVLNHVGDPRAAAAELARVAAPSARLVASTWVLSPSWFWSEVCERVGLEPAAGEKLPPEKDFERTSAGFAAMLAEGGWRGVEATELHWTWQAEPSVLWASAEGGVASAGAFYLAQDEAGRHAFRRGFDAVCDARSIGGAIPLEHTAAIAVGRPR